jgi:peptidyl-prolyl cis-trans isomerase C
LTQQLQEQSLKKAVEELKAKAKIEIAQAPAPAAPATEAVKK